MSSLFGWMQISVFARTLGSLERNHEIWDGTVIRKCVCVLWFCFLFVIDYLRILWWNNCVSGAIFQSREGGIYCHEDGACLFCGIHICKYHVIYVYHYALVQDPDSWAHRLNAELWDFWLGVLTPSFLLCAFGLGVTLLAWCTHRQAVLLAQCLLGVLTPSFLASCTLLQFKKLERVNYTRDRYGSSM